MYVFYYYLLYLVLAILSIFRKKSHKILLIQTAKIGDYANSSVVFDLASKNAPFDIVLDKINLAFSANDERIERVFLINDYKKGLKKFLLAFKIYKNNYQKIYVLMPNNYNLFLAKCAFASEVFSISHYKNSSAFVLLSRGIKLINHTKNDLSLLTYLKMFNADLTNFKQSINQAQNLAKNSKDFFISSVNLPYKKCLQKPVLIPQNLLSLDEKAFKIGISLSAGNKIKTISKQSWEQIFKILKEFNGVKIYIFGVGDELKYLQNINTSGLELVCLINKIPLNELAFYIGKMQAYISSDTGNYYIADTMNVPSICFMGPCFCAEQRGVNNSLVLKSDLTPFTAVFDTIYERDASEYFKLNNAQIKAIKDFLSSLIINFKIPQSSQH